MYADQTSRQISLLCEGCGYYSRQSCYSARTQIDTSGQDAPANAAGNDALYGLRRNQCGQVADSHKLRTNRGQSNCQNNQHEPHGVI